MSKLQGGRLCGQARYEAEGEPMFQAVRHCKNCQKQSGSAFSAIVAAPLAAFTLTGALATHDDLGEAGGVVHRRFCPKCGSPVMSEVGAAPGLALIKAGTLDDTTWLDPKMHVWCVSAQPWARIPDDAVRFERNPA